MATADFMADFYGITNLHGYSIKYQNVGIFGCSGNNIGMHQLSEEEIFSLLKRGFDKVKDSKKTVMVTHVHPSNTKMGKLGHKLVREGSKGVKKAVEQFHPDILIFFYPHISSL